MTISRREAGFIRKFYNFTQLRKKHIKSVEQQVILDLLLHRDNRAYRYLYEQYYIGLKAVANYYTQDDSAAEDLVQEVFISMLEGKKAFATLNDVKYFLYAALKNRCLNYLRSQKVRTQYYRETLSTRNDIDNYWEQVLKEDVYATLYTAIQTLPPQCRQVMLLSLEGLKLSEIAERLHLSLDTVKEYRGTGKKKLLALLQNSELAMLVTWFWL